MQLLDSQDLDLDVGVVILLDVLLDVVLDERVLVQQLHPGALPNEVAAGLSLASIDEQRSGVEAAVVSSNGYLLVRVPKYELLLAV